ncbi:MAG: hypothetical protein OSB46_11455 [Alphaproteobacteria bacterium]|nr:hypothetical protein [Alphaproteobacteria bacterium]
MALEWPGPYTESMAEPLDIEDLSRRFLDLWRQHLTAVATDPIAGPEAWLAMTRLWTQGSDNANGSAEFTSTAAALGTAPVTGAPNGSGDAVRDLERRVRELEERIANLESTGGSGS